MNKNVYFDNAATGFPKPPSVKSAVLLALEEYGGNPGRGGHSYSIKAAEKVYSARCTAADFFCAEPENVVFTQNCTHALNLAIKGIVSKGDSVVISSMEHNSVARPCFALAHEDTTVNIAQVGKCDEATVENFKRCITPKTKCVVLTAASNVTGRVMPIREIAEITKKFGICLIVDAAQAAGVIPVTLDMGANIICVPGHKGLCGPTGTGMLITDGKYPLKTIIEGGTGATSLELTQTDFMPEHLESGTLNTAGICGLEAGLKYVSMMGLENIYHHENALCEIFLDGVKRNSEIITLRTGEHFVPIVSFNLKGIAAHELATALSNEGFALRGGLHCAPLAHKTIGTLPEGTVRFSPGVFNSQKDTVNLVNTLKKFAKSGI
ncbi:MAG: aminotransferase class V-fold PLP-dependent enzyme [Oscillospiraceae bacterium]|nr:aminotransferase class V-fold PLP-dependent enzyme [Oscillospiraceae bacterium]